MKIRTPIPVKTPRLEIIPLIDIMFFLLASFMIVTLQMQIVHTVKANLPTATLATSSQKPDIVNVFVNRDGQVSVDRKPFSFESLNTLQAFAQSVHCVLNFSELSMLKEVVQKTIAENDLFLSTFRDVQRRVYQKGV